MSTYSGGKNDTTKTFHSSVTFSHRQFDNTFLLPTTQTRKISVAMDERFKVLSRPRNSLTFYTYATTDPGEDVNFSHHSNQFVSSCVQVCKLGKSQALCDNKWLNHSPRRLEKFKKVKEIPPAYVNF